jgi:hypothetical protein
VTVKGMMAGSMAMSITPGMLALVDANGQSIPNFGSITVKNLTITVQ